LSHTVSHKPSTRAKDDLTPNIPDRRIIVRVGGCDISHIPRIRTRIVIAAGGKRLIAVDNGEIALGTHDMRKGPFRHVWRGHIRGGFGDRGSFSCLSLS